MRIILRLTVIPVVAVLFSAGCATAHKVRGRDPARVVSADRAALIADLSSKEPQRQARARQLLPYHGVDALPDLLPLLSNEDPVEAKNAYYVILDMTNAACAPGRDRERERATQLLMGLLGSEKQDLKIVALRLLERSVPPDYDIGPIAALLNGPHPVLREKARAALARINTDPALKALRAALKGADAESQYAILDALAEAKDAASVRIAAEMSSHPDARVRLAAARVLAWTGDPAYAATVESVVSRADDATKKDALDVLLRYAQAMETKDGAAANGIYARLLDRPEGPVLQAAAAGFGRTGDADAAKRLMKLLDSPDASVRHAVINAMRLIEGDGVTALMLEAYVKTRPEDRRVFLLALGSRKSASVIEPLRVAAGSDDAVMRRTAFAALAESGQPEAIDVLVDAAAHPKEGDIESIQTALARLVANIKDAAQPARSARAYRTLFELGTDADMRLLGLKGLAENASVDLFDVAMKAAADDALKGAAADLLVGVAAAAYVGGDTSKARATLDALGKIDSSIQRLQAYAGKVKALGGTVDISSLLGGIRKWWIVGPFKAADLALDWATDFVNEKDVDLKATYTNGGQSLTWKAVEGDGDLCVVDLAAQTGAPSNCYGYAYAEITVGERQLATLRLGSDDGIAAWVNGAKVHDNFVDRGTTPDSDIVQIRLEPGINKLLLKISQGGGGWNFCARITDRDARPLDFKQ